MVRAPESMPTLLAPLPPGPRRSKGAAEWLATVRRSAPTFRRWPAHAPAPLDTKGGKWLVDVDGEPMFAELAILRALENDGWTGRWIDNYPMPPTFRTAYWDKQWNKLSRVAADSPLPERPRQVYQAICSEAGDSAGAGAWDVIAWRGEEMAFLEAKRLGSSDGIGDAQLDWLAAAHRLKVPKESLLFVEWSAV